MNKIYDTLQRHLTKISYEQVFTIKTLWLRHNSQRCQIQNAIHPFFLVQSLFIYYRCIYFSKQEYNLISGNILKKHFYAKNVMKSGSHKYFLLKLATTLFKQRKLHKYAEHIFAMRTNSQWGEPGNGEYSKVLGQKWIIWVPRCQKLPDA